jgi:hypothetical protein
MDDIDLPERLAERSIVHRIRRDVCRPELCSNLSPPHPLKIRVERRERAGKIHSIETAASVEHLRREVVVSIDNWRRAEDPLRLYQLVPTGVGISRSAARASAKKQN